MRILLLICVVCVLAGCGKSERSVTTVPATTTTHAANAFAVGVVGPLALNVPGARLVRGTLANLQGMPLVVASARAIDPRRIARAADSHPDGHFVLVGASTKGLRRPNLLGVVLRRDQAALLGGVVAGIVATDQGGATPRVAWVGPGTVAQIDDFARGVHHDAPGVVVLRSISPPAPAACKEAALAALARGAVALIARGGLCGDAVGEAAHEQNQVALTLGDFELPGVAAGIVIRDASRGVYHGGEDLVFGASSGAIGVRNLDSGIEPATVIRAHTAAQEVASGLRGSG